eukprot:SAG11_NODE_5634_length_1501_cov_1.169757_2_plen_185_part_00
MALFYTQMKAEFAPFLPAVMEPIFKSMQSDQVVEWDAEEEDSDLEEDIGDDDDEEGLATLLPGKGFSVRTGMLDEMASASMCCGNLAEHSPPAAFAPYLERATTVLTELCDYFHEDIKGVARTSLGYVLNVVHQLYPADASTGALHPTTQQLNTQVMTIYTSTLVQEPDIYVVARTCSTLSNMW